MSRLRAFVASFGALSFGPGSFGNPQPFARVLPLARGLPVRPLLAVAFLVVACSGGSEDGAAGVAVVEAPNPRHAEYLAGVAGAEPELVEPGGEGAWREIRSGERVLRLEARPERIASRTLATDEILLEIAEPERIVLLSPFAGDPAYTRSADAARRLGRVGGFSTEEVLAASPDLAFLAGFNSRESLAQLEAAAVPVLVLDNHESLAAIESNIRAVGFAIGRELQAQRLVEKMRLRLEKARERAGARAAGLRVVHYGGGVVLGQRTVFDDAIRHLGAVNVAARAGLVGWPRISTEQVVLWNPDVIFTDSGTGAGTAGDPAAGVSDGTRAAGLGNVVRLDGRDMAAISHHVVGLVDELADALVRAAERIEAAEGRDASAVDTECSVECATE